MVKNEDVCGGVIILIILVMIFSSYIIGNRMSIIESDISDMHINDMENLIILNTLRMNTERLLSLPEKRALICPYLRRNEIYNTEIDAFGVECIVKNGGRSGNGNETSSITHIGADNRSESGLVTITCECYYPNDK